MHKFFYTHIYILTVGYRSVLEAGNGRWLWVEAAALEPIHGICISRTAEQLKAAKSRRTPSTLGHAVPPPPPSSSSSETNNQSVEANSNQGAGDARA
jgi:hypothetical protein